MKLAFFMNLVVQILFIFTVFMILFLDPIYDSFFSPQVLGKYTENVVVEEATACDYDVDLNGVVDELDIADIRVQYFKLPITNDKSDVNKDGVVDILDLLIAMNFMYQSCP